MRAHKLFLAALLAAAPLGALAVDSPHDAPFTTGSCQACHKLHNAAGPGLGTQAVISNACISCHSAAGIANPTNQFGYPWTTGQQADIAAHTGAHHRWDALTENATAGATAPADPEMVKRIVNGRLECSVCHNQHSSNKAFSMPNSMRISYAVGTAQARTAPAAASAVRLTVTAANLAAASAKGYLVRTTAANAVAVSHDNGLSWFKPAAIGGASWIADTAVPAGGPFTPGTAFQLDDGTAISISISTGAVAGDTWQFYVAAPFVRSVNIAGEVCVTCHQSRNLTHTDIEGPTAGAQVFSHPVGVALTKPYDRAIPLDADAGVQGVNGDTNVTNDLDLGFGNVVTCTTCHSVHRGDSNSITVHDAP